MLFRIKYKTWDRRKRSLFTVEGCSPKTNRVISRIVKYTEKMGPGKSVHYKEVFTNQECSLWEVSGDDNMPLQYLLASHCQWLNRRSLATTKLLEPKTTTRWGPWAFNKAAPVLWNTESSTIKIAPSLASFKLGLKTYLFKAAFL